MRCGGYVVESQPARRAVHPRRLRRGADPVCPHTGRTAHLRSRPAMELLSAAVPRRAYVRRLLVDLFAFTACAFALTWIVVGLYIWNADAATRALGPLRLGAPAFYLAVYAPSLAAIAIPFPRSRRAGRSNLSHGQASCRVE